MLRQAYEEGRRAALARFKLATGYPGCASTQLTPAQTTASAMPMAPVKSPVSPTAPAATGTPRAAVLG
jgi:hypothetical protein